MKLDNYNTQSNQDTQTVPPQARQLMSANRQRTQQRAKSMLTRVAAELKIID
jgi:hypothetical protein